MTGLLMCGVLVLLLVGADRWERSERARRDRRREIPWPALPPARSWRDLGVAP